MSHSQVEIISGLESADEIDEILTVHLLIDSAVKDRSYICWRNGESLFDIYSEKDIPIKLYDVLYMFNDFDEAVDLVVVRKITDDCKILVSWIDKVNNVVKSGFKFYDNELL